MKLEDLEYNLRVIHRNAELMLDVPLETAGKYIVLAGDVPLRWTGAEILDWPRKLKLMTRQLQDFPRARYSRWDSTVGALFGVEAQLEDRLRLPDPVGEGRMLLRSMLTAEVPAPAPPPPITVEGPVMPSPLELRRRAHVTQLRAELSAPYPLRFK